MKRNTFLLAAASVVVLGGTMLGAGNVYAQGSGWGDGPNSSMAQKLADKFGLNKDEVQAVFDQTHSQMQAERESRQKARLSQLVTDGKITEAQKQLIIAKHEEMEATRETHRASMKDATPEQRKATMEAHRASMESWAKENGIDLQNLMMGEGKGMRGRGPGRSM